MWPETTRLLLDIVADASQPDALIVASRTGSLSLAERPSAARHLTKEAKARNDAGLNAEMWTPEQVAEATGGRLNTQTLQGALWLPDEGRLHPLTLLAHLARAARTAGVRLIGNARVEAREEVKGRGSAHGWRLTLAGGTTISARGLVLATGPTATPTARIYALTFPASLPDDFPLFWDSAPYTYCDFRPGNGRLGVSGGRYGRVGLAKRDAHYHQQLADAARHWLPELADVPPSHAWAVDLAVTADMVPNLVTIGEHAPGQSIEGLGALGVLPGSVLGRQAGEMVAKRVG
jgi:L-pipecolate oxidase